MVVVFNQSIVLHRLSGVIKGSLRSDRSRAPARLARTSPVS